MGRKFLRHACLVTELLVTTVAVLCYYEGPGCDGAVISVAGAVIE
jgi:hypothetical protein